MSGISADRLEDNIKMYLQQDESACTGFICLRTGNSGGLF